MTKCKFQVQTSALYTNHGMDRLQYRIKCIQFEWAKYKIKQLMLSYRCHNCQSTMLWVDGTPEELRTCFSACNSLVQATTFGDWNRNPSREGGRRCQGPRTVILYNVVHNHQGIFLRSSSVNKKARGARATFL